MISRVWDRYLTAQDKAHIANSPVKTIAFGTRPGVVSVDFYRAAFGDKNVPLLEGIKEWPGYCGPASWASLPHTQRLMQVARATSVPIFHFTNLTPEICGVPSWWEALYDSPPQQTALMDEAARDRHRRRFEIVDEVAPLPGEVVLYKTAPSVFYGTPLLAHLNHLDIDTLLIAGESTSGCVRATVVDAASHRFKVKVIEPCVFDRHEAAHAMNLFDMDQKYADVISIDAAVEYLNALQQEADSVGKGRILMASQRMGY
jgi:nicotinamidase-related amidase